MSLVRAALTAIQAIVNHVANTAPNPSPEQGRYHTDELFIFRIAPRVFEVEQPLVWILAILEITTILSMKGLIPFAPSITPLLCPASNPDIRLTFPFVVGVILVTLSTFILLLCYNVLGRHFTYYLTIRDKHELVTSQLYSYVRHPSYTGTLLLIASIPLSHVTSGSWLVECGFMNPCSTSIMVAWGVWWVWGALVSVRRAKAEDAQLRKQFGNKWDEYAARVPYRFIPGLL